MTGDERNKVPQFTDVWIDIGVKDKKEAEELVQLGDPATFALGYRPMRNGLAASPGMDDKVGSVGGHGSAAAAAWQTAAGGGLLCFDGTGRDRPARRDDQQLRHSSHRRHRG